MDKDFLNQEDYKYGFHDEDTSLYKTEKGLTRETVMEISRIKKEPQWMLEYRLKAFEQFEKMEIQNWGPDIHDINFDDYTYYVKPSDKTEKSWDDVPETIKETFEN